MHTKIGQVNFVLNLGFNIISKAWVELLIKNSANPSFKSLMEIVDVLVCFWDLLLVRSSKLELQ